MCSGAVVRYFPPVSNTQPQGRLKHQEQPNDEICAVVSDFPLQVNLMTCRTTSNCVTHAIVGHS